MWNNPSRRSSSSQHQDNTDLGSHNNSYHFAQRLILKYGHYHSSLKMKLSSVVPFLATVTAAAAAPFINPVIRPMLPVDVFNVTDFYAGSIPHSVWSTTKFFISVTTIQPPTLCTAETQSYQHVGDFVQNNCTEPTVSFSLTRTGRADHGAELDIFWSLGDTGLMKGTYFIPGSQFVTSGLGTRTIRVRRVLVCRM
ncbi:hypothetical protein B0H66DRAFT_149870 [Apodospora peruviana]|uniref:Uncharacterized protein n=1 Tax=Apodospora peruviana TaxID=516989 RepID=A0AAE0MBC4_9PEZI|nr:hypothetical protein B0H66DRAFT_149870 [Apodospora peruviana]